MADLVPHQLKNGMQTVRRSDGAVWLDQSKGFDDTPGWYDQRGIRRSDQADGSLSGQTLANGKETMRRDDGAVWMDQSKGWKKDPGWYNRDGSRAVDTTQSGLLGAIWHGVKSGFGDAADVPKAAWSVANHPVDAAVSFANKAEQGIVNDIPIAFGKGLNVLGRMAGQDRPEGAEYIGPDGMPIHAAHYDETLMDVGHDIINANEQWKADQTAGQKLAYGVDPESEAAKIGGFAGDVASGVFKAHVLGPAALAVFAGEAGVSKASDALDDGNSMGRSLVAGGLDAATNAAIMAMPGGQKAFQTLRQMVINKATRGVSLGTVGGLSSSAIDQFILNKNLTPEEVGKRVLSSIKMMLGYEGAGAIAGIKPLNEAKAVAKNYTDADTAVKQTGIDAANAYADFESVSKMEGASPSDIAQKYKEAQEAHKAAAGAVYAKKAGMKFTGEAPGTAPEAAPAETPEPVQTPSGVRYQFRGKRSNPGESLEDFEARVERENPTPEGLEAYKNRPLDLTDEQKAELLAQGFPGTGTAKLTVEPDVVRPETESTMGLTRPTADSPLQGPATPDEHLAQIQEGMLSPEDFVNGIDDHLPPSTPSPEAQAHVAAVMAQNTPAAAPVEPEPIPSYPVPQIDPDAVERGTVAHKAMEVAKGQLESIDEAHKQAILERKGDLILDGVQGLNQAEKNRLARAKEEMRVIEKRTANARRETLKKLNEGLPVDIKNQEDLERYMDMAKNDSDFWHAKFTKAETGMPAIAQKALQEASGDHGAALASIHADMAHEARQNGGTVPFDRANELNESIKALMEAPDPTDRRESGTRNEDRRADTSARKTVGQMTPEEMRQSLLTDDMTGLGNKRAWEETPKKPHVGFLDVDSLKWTNDNLGHEAGDALLSKVGEAMKAAGIGNDSFHVSGDEFMTHGDDPVALEANVKKVNEYLAKNPIEATIDGEPVTLKGSVSYGIGESVTEADTRLQNDKSQRELHGERAGRGNEPPGLGKKVSGEEVGNKKIIADTYRIGGGRGSGSWDKSGILANALSIGKFETVSIKGGDSVRLVLVEDPDGQMSRIAAFDSLNNPIGDLSYARVKDEAGDFVNPGVEVDPKWQRKGVATAMYNLAEKNGGMIAQVSDGGQIRTEDGAAFREARAKSASIGMESDPMRSQRGFIDNSDLLDGVKKKMGLPEGASDLDLAKAVLGRIGKLGASVRETAIKIMGQFKGMAREVADKVAEYLHSMVDGSRESQLGAIGKLPKDFKPMFEAERDPNAPMTRTEVHDEVNKMFPGDANKALRKSYYDRGMLTKQHYTPEDINRFVATVDKPSEVPTEIKKHEIATVATRSLVDDFFDRLPSVKTAITDVTKDLEAVLDGKGGKGIDAVTDAMKKLKMIVNPYRDGTHDFPEIQNSQIMGSAPKLEKDMPNFSDDGMIGKTGRFLQSIHNIERTFFPNGFGPTIDRMKVDIHELNLKAQFSRWAADTMKGYGIKDASDQIKERMAPIAQRFLAASDKLRSINEAGKAATDPAAHSAQYSDDVMKANEEMKSATAERDSAVKELARQHVDARVYLAAEMPQGKIEPWLEKLMSKSEIEAADKIRTGMQKMKGALVANNIETLGDNQEYMTHLITNLAPDYFRAMKRDGKMPPDVLNFHSRVAGSQTFFPSVNATMDYYIPTVSRKLALQPFIDKWKPAVDEYANPLNKNKTLNASDYVKSFLQDMGVRQESTPLDKTIDAVREYERLKLLSYSISTSYKHMFKMLAMASNQHVWLLPATKAYFQAKSADIKYIDQAMENLGFDRTDARNRLALMNAFVSQKQMSSVIQETNLGSASNEGNFAPMMRAFLHIAKGGTVESFGRKTLSGVKSSVLQPTATVEALENGLNLFASLARGHNADIGLENNINQAMMNMLDYNQRGGADASAFSKNKVARTMFMFHQTPTKIAENYYQVAKAGMNGGKDIYSSDNTGNAIRMIMVLGAAKMAADKMGMNADAIFHMPFFNPKYWIHEGKYIYFKATGQDEEADREAALNLTDKKGAVMTSPALDLKNDWDALHTDPKQIITQTPAYKQGRAVVTGEAPNGYDSLLDYVTKTRPEGAEEEQDYRNTKRGLKEMNKTRKRSEW